jgi:hypothetical protein
MDATLTSTDALSVIGFFLTLVGLLGSFFYIHLSDWLREVIALETKWRINRAGDDKKAVRRECRYEIEQVANWTTLLTSVMVTTFVILVFVLGALLWLAQPEKNAAWTYIGLAGAGFMTIYLVMICYLLGSGYVKARRLYSTVLDYFKQHPDG